MIVISSKWSSKWWNYCHFIKMPVNMMKRWIISSKWLSKWWNDASFHQNDYQNVEMMIIWSKWLSKWWWNDYHFIKMLVNQQWFRRWPTNSRGGGLLRPQGGRGARKEKQKEMKKEIANLIGPELTSWPPESPQT